MLFIFGLLLVMIPTAPCLEFHCRFNQTDPCYTALGHTLYLKMVLDARGLELEFKKWINNITEEPIIIVKKDKIKHKHESITNRSEFIINNGTLIINSVIRSDSGRYTLKLFNSAGVESHSADLQVNVEAPVGSVEVSINCSSSGGRRVFCSSGGEQLLFSWTLNGVPLTQELQDGNQTLHLEEETAGNITCSVKNHVSHQQKTINIIHCAETTAATSDVTPTGPRSTSENVLLPIVLGCLALLLILLLVTAHHVYKKKQLKPTAAAAGGDTELVYAQINHKHNRKTEQRRSELSPAADVEYVEVGHQKTKRKERKMKKEEEVQYGEVTFTPAVSNAQQRSKEQEDCVYSQVQRQ